MQVLLDARADIDAEDDIGRTALMKAASENANPAIIMTLLSAGANAMATDRDGRCASDFAKNNDKLQGTDALLKLEEACPSSPEANNQEKLEDVTVVDIQEALTQGLDPAQRDKAGNTILMFVISRTTDPMVVTTLVDAGVNIDARDKVGRTALMLAVRGWDGDPEIVKALINAGADVNAIDHWGQTALILATTYEPDLEIITALLTAGADVNIQDTNGQTALLNATSSRNLEVFTALIRAGATFDTSGEFVYSVAKSAKNPTILKALIDDGMDINIKDKDGNTPLMAAAEFNDNPDIITTLVNAGANVNAQNSIGLTALIYASGNNTPEIIKALLDAGANTASADIYNQKAIDYLNNNDSIYGEVFRELSELLQ